jgi:hypothetical protein
MNHVLAFVWCSGTVPHYHANAAGASAHPDVRRLSIGIQPKASLQPACSGAMPVVRACGGVEHTPPLPSNVLLYLLQSTSSLSGARPGSSCMSTASWYAAWRVQLLMQSRPSSGSAVPQRPPCTILPSKCCCWCRAADRAHHRGGLRHLQHPHRAQGPVSGAAATPPGCHVQWPRRLQLSTKC